MKNVKLIEKKLRVAQKYVSFNSQYKMGGEMVLSCAGVSVNEDTRTYYSGRGAKYNRDIRHSYQEIILTQKKLNDIYREFSFNEKIDKLRNDARIKQGKRIHECPLKYLGVKLSNYYIWHSAGYPVQLCYRMNGLGYAINLTPRIKTWCIEKGILFIDTENGFDILKDHGIEWGSIDGQLFPEKTFVS